MFSDRLVEIPCRDQMYNTPDNLSIYRQIEISQICFVWFSVWRHFSVSKDDLSYTRRLMYYLTFVKVSTLSHVQDSQSSVSSTHMECTR